MESSVDRNMNDADRYTCRLYKQRSGYMTGNRQRVRRLLHDRQPADHSKIVHTT